ncbi:MAG: 7-cyano-7-deazaguanine synthase [Fusobacteriaceae bacterium]
MQKKIKALALFSGGLDSSLAIKIVKEQGVEVVALNFVSHFFGGKNDKAENMAKQLGVKLEYVQFKERHLEIVKNPVFGRGKNMNPCIDCHSLMFQVAGELMHDYEADFIISGEVLGQRPMSQNFQALEKVQKLSGMGDLILRPLSAKLLPETKPEKEGWIDREKLLDIRGRSRNYQMELMNKFEIIDYPSPGGGCLLTDPDYSKKIRSFEQDGLLDEKFNELFYMTKVARVFRFSPQNYIFVGRDDTANKKLLEYEKSATHIIKNDKIPGPVILMVGNFSSAEIKLACEFFSRYSKVKGKEKITVNLDGKIFETDIIDVEKTEKLMREYQDMGRKK